jgi:hypothetical protein
VQSPPFSAPLVQQLAHLLQSRVDDVVWPADGSKDYDAFDYLIRYWHVAPALWVRLRQHPGVPMALRAMLRAHYLENVQRNGWLRAQLIWLCGELNPLGITPMVLKGGCQLFDPPSGHAGVRYMTDLDVLVRPGQDQLAYAHLQTLGFLPEQTWIPERCHQWPKLIRAEDGFGVEIHRAPWERAGAREAQALWQDAVRVADSPVPLFLPSITHRLVHNAIHGFTDWPFRYLAVWQPAAQARIVGSVDLKQLYDFVEICQLRPGELAWPEVLRTAERFGRLPEFQQWAALAQQLFGLDLPPGVGRWEQERPGTRGLGGWRRRWRIRGGMLAADTLRQLGLLAPLQVWKTRRWLQRRGF